MTNKRGIALNVDKGKSRKKTSSSHGQNHLFVIAIDEYQSMPRLYNCVKDAEAIIEVLTKRYKFEKENLVFLQNGQATKRKILYQLETYGSTLTEDDNLLLYFAGHGNIHPGTKRGYWLSVESVDWTDGVQNRTIADLLHKETLSARHVLLIIDSCFSGSFFRIRSSPGQEKRKSLEAVERMNSRWAITSGGLETVSDGIIHSPFAQRLLGFLRSNNERGFKALVLGDVIQDLVSINSDQTPRNEPLGIGHEGGQFVFYLREVLSEDIIAFNKLKKNPNKEELEEFILNFPLSHIQKEALDLLLQLEEEEDWQMALNRGTFGGFHSFIKRYPNSKYLGQAKGMAIDLRKVGKPINDSEKKSTLSQKLTKPSEDTINSIIDFKARNAQLYHSYKNHRARLIKTIEIALNLFSDLKLLLIVKELEELLDDISIGSQKIMVVGEFNTGKSTLINALLGLELLPTKALPATAIVSQIRYGKDPKARIHYRDLSKSPVDIKVEELKEYVLLYTSASRNNYETRDSVFSHAEIFWPIELLRECNLEIIDTPGLNESEIFDKLTTDYLGLQEVDVVLFIMSAVRFGPAQTELEFIRRLEGADYKDLFFVINQNDLLRSRQLDEVRSKAIHELKKLTTRKDDIYFVSSLDALEGRIDGDHALESKSGFQEFELYLHKFLSDKGMIKNAMFGKSFLGIIEKAKNQNITLQYALEHSENISKITQLKIDMEEQLKDLI